MAAPCVGIGDAIVYYRGELIRLIAQMGLGAGALAGHRRHHRHRRLPDADDGRPGGRSGLQPVLVHRCGGPDRFRVGLLQRPVDRAADGGVGMAATIGAGATAQLGAMRINEEIDALEVIGIRTIAYLASARVIAGIIVVIPLYCVAVLMSFLAARVGTTFIYGQSTGVYDHYFRTFLNPDRPDLVVPASGFDGVGHHAGAHLLRVHRVGRTGRRRRGRRPRGAHLVDRRGVRRGDDLAGRLRPVRQLQPGGISAWTTKTRPAPRRGGRDPGRGSRRRRVADRALFTGTLKSYVDGHADLGPLRAGDGDRRQGEDARCAGRPGQRHPGRPGIPSAFTLEIYPDQVKFIPANVEAQIRATTVFGAKFVDLIYPERSRAAAAGGRPGAQVQQCQRRGQHRLREPRRPARSDRHLEAERRCPALAEGVRGQGERIGQATTDANQVLLALNPRSETIRADWQALKGFSDAYSGAATNIVNTLMQLSTTSVTITNNAKPLDALLLNVIGLSNSGIALLAPNQQNLIKAINVLEPTTNLLMKYSPEYTCMLVGAKWLLDNGAYDAPGGNGKSFIVDGGILAWRRPVPLSAEPADHRRQGRSGWKAGLRLAADRGRQLAGAPAGHQHRLGHRRRHPAQPGHRLPGLRRLLPGDPRRAGAAEHPQPVRRARDRDRSRIPARATSRTVRRCTRPMAPRSGRACRRRRRRARRVIPVPTPGSEPFVVPFPAQQQPTPLPPHPLPVPAAPSP